RPVQLDLAPVPPVPPPLKTAGWIVAGVGLAGIVLGGVAGGFAISKKSDLDKAGCTGGFCPVSTKPDVDTYDVLLPATSAGLIGGAVLLTAGLVPIILSAAQRPAATGVRWSPFVGLGSAGIQGTF